ncbi:MAG TPA: hypothetical protein VK509_07100, partial [Polyangiales bacterium]|nr:hypothetical protein [Polyangiales bacterium]
ATRTYEPALQRDTIFAARALRSAWPAAPEPIAAVIDRALRFEPDARWADAGSMQRALRAARRGGQLPAGDAAELATDARRSDPTVMLAAALHASTARARRRVLGIVAAALLVLAVAVLLAARARRLDATPGTPRPALPTLPAPAPSPAMAIDAAPAAATRVAAPKLAPAPAPLVPALVPRGVDAPAAEAAAGKRSGAANAAKSKRPARRRYDRVARDIVDPWE